MPEVKFALYKGCVYVDAMNRLGTKRIPRESWYSYKTCSSAWELFQVVNEHVQSGWDLSTIELDVPYVPGFNETLADPGVDWHSAYPDRLLILPKHSEDMEEMEAFSVELWELAVRLTQGATT